MDESGLTRFSGGWLCFIVPAGYIGSSLIGCVLLFTGFSQRASRWMAGVIGVILVITCLLAGSFMTLLMGLGLSAFLGSAVWYQEGKYTQYLILFMGTIGSVVSLLNILGSTVFHTIEGSDATVFASKCSILIPAFVYGIIWLAISAIIIGLSLCLAIKYQK